MASNNFIIRYGKFSGPGYSGGVVLASGQNITATQTAVAAVNYIDSLAKQHDVNYQYFEKTFAGDKVALNRALWEADKAAVMSALQFTPTNWIERDYRELFINAFIGKAQSSLAGYGADSIIVAEAKALQLQVTAADPSIRQLGTMNALFGVNNNIRFALQDIVTSNLSSQEIMFFNSHLKSLSDIVIPNTTAEGGPTVDSNDFTRRPINPTSDSNGNLVANVRIGNNLVEMTLNNETRDFTKIVKTLDGNVVRTEDYVNQRLENFGAEIGYRAYNYTEKDATGTLVRTLAIAQPLLPTRLQLDGDVDRLSAINAGVNAQGKYDNANTTIPTFVATGFVAPNTPQITAQMQADVAALFGLTPAEVTPAVLVDYLRDDDGSLRITINRGDQLEVRVADSSGVLSSKQIVTPQPDGSTQLQRYNGSNQLQSTTLQQTYDDGSRLETITTPDGKVVQKSFDTDNQLTGTITDTPDGLGGTNRAVIAVVNGKEVEILQHASAAALAVDKDNDGNFIDDGDFDTTDIDIDDQDALDSDLLENALDNDYLSAQAIIRGVGTSQLAQLIAAGDSGDADGMTPVEGYSDAPGQETAWYATADAKGFGDALTNIQSLVAALKSGNPLPIGAAVFNLAANLSKSAELGQIAGGLNTLNSLNGLVNALERGDEFGALASGAGFLNNAYSTDNKNYQKHSCLRPSLLGYSNKKYLRTGQNCAKLASSRSISCLQVQKRPDLRVRSCQTRLFTGASSYEQDSVLCLYEVNL